MSTALEKLASNIAHSIDSNKRQKSLAVLLQLSEDDFAIEQRVIDARIRVLEAVLADINELIEQERAELTV